MKYRYNMIINDDFLNVDKYYPDECIDLCITSPPYNVDLGNNKYNKTPYDIYRDNKDHKDYLFWLLTIFKKVYKKLKSGGRCVINIGDQKNGAVPTHSDVIQFMVHDLNFIPMSTIVWNKNTTSNRCAWGTFMSPMNPSFPTPIEYILIFAKDRKNLIGKAESDLTRRTFVDWAYGLWSFTPEIHQKEIGHPSPFPEELPRRCISMLSWVDAIVLDPMCGVGTTLKAAKDLGRRYIGFDISEDYCDKARKRLEE